MNWIHYVFFGADIHESARDWLLDQLRAIAALPVGNADDDRVRGLFFASHDVQGMSEWRIRDGQLTVVAAGVEYGYLDG